MEQHKGRNTLSEVADVVIKGYLMEHVFGDHHNNMMAPSVMDEKKDKESKEERSEKWRKKKEEDNAKSKKERDAKREKEDKEKESKKKSEKDKDKDEKKEGPKHNKMRKMKGGGRGDLDFSSSGKKTDEYTQEKLSDIVLNGPYNISQIADFVYKDKNYASPQSRQSKLRKKLEGEETPSGGNYALTDTEAKAIRRYLGTFK